MRYKIENIKQAQVIITTKDGNKKTITRRGVREFDFFIPAYYRVECAITDKALLEVDDRTYIPLCNVKEISKIKVTDYYQVWKIVKDSWLFGHTYEHDSSHDGPTRPVGLD